MSSDRRVGVWLVGGRGSVATTALTGAAAVAAGLAEPTGLITMRPPFTGAGLPDLGDLVFGGHDVVETPLAMRAARLMDDGVLPIGLPAALGGALEAAESEQRPGITGREARTEPVAALARIIGRSQRLPGPPRSESSRRRQRVLHRGAGRSAPRSRGPQRADGRARPGPRDPATEFTVRAGRRGDRVCVRGLHAVRGRAAPRPGDAGRDPRGAARGQRRQDRRDVLEVGDRAGLRARALCACARGPA